MVRINYCIRLFFLNNSADIINLSQNAFVVLFIVLAYHLEEHFDAHS